MSGTGTTSGTIRGFNSINLGQNNTVEAIAPTNFSLTELRDRINTIRTTFDPSYLEDLITRVLTHIQSTDNPHQVTLAQTGANILQLVYEEWLTLGNTGTINDFYAAFFQLLPVTTATDLATAAPTSLISVDGAEQLLATHNADPNAHAALIDEILPGAPPTSFPAYAINAMFPIPATVTAIRSTPITVINQDGSLSTLPANTPAVDYGNGIAEFSVYGPRTNFIYPSDPTVNTNVVLAGCTSTVVPKPASGRSLAPDGNAYLLLTESTVSEIHGFGIPVGMTAGTLYTTSIFVYPFYNSITDGLTCYLNNYATTIAMMLDLATMTVTTTNASVIGYAQQLPNGWIRLGLQFTAPATDAPKFVVAKTLTPTLGSPVAYLGSGELLFAIFGMQHVQGCGMSPYIPTTTTAALCDGTTLSLPITLYSGVDAMFLATYNHAPSNTGASRVIFALTQTGSNTGITVSSVTSYLVAQIVNTDTTLASLQLDDEFNTPAAVALSISATDYSIKATGQARVDQVTTLGAALTAGAATITFGGSATPFDGTISTFSYYPVADASTNLEFLVGES